MRNVAIMTDTLTPEHDAAAAGVRLAAIGEKRFLLFGAHDRPPHAASSSITALGEWLVDKPWMAYSLEFPITRRFWLTQLGRPFCANL